MKREFRNDQECLIFESNSELADYWEKRLSEFSFEGQKMIQIMIDFYREKERLNNEVQI